MANKEKDLTYTEIITGRRETRPVTHDDCDMCGRCPSCGPCDCEEDADEDLSK
jgi:hypothetical protein